MTTRIQIDVLRQVKILMDAMLIQAQKKNWPELTQLDEKRRQLLGYTPESEKADALRNQVSAFGREGISPPKPKTTTPEPRHAVSPEYTALCDSILDLDKQINQVVHTVRGSLMKENRSLQAQVSAKRNYAQACSTQATSFR